MQPRHLAYIYPVLIAVESRKDKNLVHCRFSLSFTTALLELISHRHPQGFLYRGGVTKPADHINLERTLATLRAYSLVSCVLHSVQYAGTLQALVVFTWASNTTTRYRSKRHAKSLATIFTRSLPHSSVSKLRPLTQHYRISSGWLVALRAGTRKTSKTTKIHIKNLIVSLARINVRYVPPLRRFSHSPG